MFALTGLGFQINRIKQREQREYSIELKENKNKDQINLNEKTVENKDKDTDINKDNIKYDYERVKNIDYIEMEFNPHPGNVFRYWNMTVGIWLKRYVRDRFIFYKNLKPSSLRKNIGFLFTFIISAFWHGFYPSYYITFTHFPFMIMLYQNYEKINRIYKITEKAPKIMNFIYL
jgi:hypothetical protein